MQNLDQIILTTALQKFNLNRCVSFPYGSRVYGTASDKSDYDFLVLTDAYPTGSELHDNIVTLQTVTEVDFRSQLADHKIRPLEAYYLPDGHCKALFPFTLNKSKLRSELSQKASHSFVKAKKKLEVEKDYYVGWKSLFHSIRILMFGIQIGQTGTIHDFGEANHHWFDILNAQQYNWTYFKEKYQPIYNALATEFRKVAPKDA